VAEETKGSCGKDECAGLDVTESDFRLDSGITLNANGLWGTYTGTLDLKGRPNGKGAIISTNNRALFEGYFTDGEKHGTARYIKDSFSSPFVKVKEGRYHDGQPVGLFTEVKHSKGFSSIIEVAMQKLVNKC
jgi:hypothetical protein